MANEKIAASIVEATTLISVSTTDAEIIAALESVGLTAERRNAGPGLLTAAQTAIDAADTTRAEQLQATKTFQSDFKAARNRQADLARVCRAVFVGNPTALAQLGLNAPTPKAYADFVRAAEKLYNVALTGPAEVGATLSTYGYPAARLTDEKGQLVNLSAAKTAQERARGTTQDAGASQTAALKALAGHVAQVRKLARVALKARPQLLERLGILARSAG